MKQLLFKEQSVKHRKPIQVSDRTHEIIRRESFTQSLESTIEKGDVSMGDVVAREAEKINTKRGYIKDGDSK